MNLTTFDSTSCNSCITDNGIVPVPTEHKRAPEQSPATETKTPCFPYKVEVDLTRFSFTVHAQCLHDVKIVAETLLPQMIYAKTKHYTIKKKLK